MSETNLNLPVKPTTSRVGRATQRYNEESGARMVAGCICLNDAKDKVVMILSSAHKGQWVFPKGGIETDEGDDFVVSAVRETWEEAGCEGRVLEKLPVVLDMRGRKAPVVSVEDRQKDFDPLKQVPRLEFHFYELLVLNMAAQWPEADKRERRWCTYSEAKHELLKAKRPELVSALDSSCIVRDSEGVEGKDEY
ncbi:CIC11C00000001174 [Sungouiella intermedia]|uniref:CIC11C00000001174 n=1 Tax=Sungouiella intermedia TaxID=45354 RepID=A0A1L0DGX5_9ASCO|nr:CIC11C00000001174 [[Candida] intermedia]